MASPLRSLLTPLCNLLFLASSFPAWYRFKRSVTDLRKTQERVLQKIVQQNRYSKFGREYDFAAIDCAEDFLKKVSVNSYEDLSPYIELIKKGEQGVLTQERVHMFEPTSGSSAATKYIPYTQTLLAQFQEAVGPWIFDLYSNFPPLLCGRAYWSITPLAPKEKETAGAIPIGMEEDAAYFGGLRQLVLSLLLVMPKEVAKIRDRENFQYTTLLFLLAADDLSLISAWSPTFLLSVLEPFSKWRNQLADDLEFGTLGPPNQMNEELRHTLTNYLSKAPSRARQVRKSEDGKELWPKLGLVSAWADWTAARYVDKVKRLFPGARFQPKGLLATEGVVSFPLVSQNSGAVLAATSHFFDFIDKDGEVHLAHQLVEGESYEVNITTGGGLYRYRLGDKVEITGFYGELPLMRFVGRTTLVSDWFGEKLNEQHVQAVLDELFAKHPEFALLALEHEPKPHYVFWCSEECTQMLAALEEQLCQNHHYAGCRKLGQLEKLEVCQIDASKALTAIVKRGEKEGKREGDIKPSLLDRRADWKSWFQ